MHAALRAARLPPPYLLVGHSAGGLYVRVFAATYPAEVVGLVLVDPVPEDFNSRAQRESPRVYQRLDSISADDIASGSPGEQAEAAEWEKALTADERAAPRSACEAPPPPLLFQ
ncbi:MAG: alpha/beta hydrolase [Gemmatimonadetes bacterium]|nr:alpha/beta hydrolase [Gemmatimonadota bacterium]